MRRTVGIVFVIVMVVGGLASMVLGAPTGVSRTEVGRGKVGGNYTVKGAEGTDIVVQKVTIEPGATAAWHTHPGAETAIVAAGTLTLFRGEDPKCTPREVKAGEVVVGDGRVHQGKNLGQDPVQIVVTYFDVPTGAAAASPAERPSNCPE